MLVLLVLVAVRIDETSVQAVLRYYREVASEILGHGAAVTPAG
jgi:hypothetical protein